MDSFKDQKFSLMDNLDSLTDKEVKDLGDKSPKAMIKSTINSIENSIARGDCNVAKDIAIQLEDGTVARYNGILVITPEEIEIVSELIVMAEDCIKQQGIDAIDAQIDHIDGLIESGSEDGLGGCTTALDLANDLKLLDSVNGDQRGEIDTAITRAQTCIEIRERPLREEKERINKVHTNLEKYKKWYSILLDDYGVALSGFNLAISPNDFNFDIECFTNNKKQWKELQTEVNTKFVNAQSLGLSNDEIKLLRNLNNQVEYFTFVCWDSRTSNCSSVPSNFPPEEYFFDFVPSVENLSSKLIGEDIKSAGLLEKSQCNKRIKKFVTSWGDFKDLKKSDMDQSLYNEYLDSYILMLNEEILDYRYAEMSDMEYVENEIESYSGNDKAELESFREDHKLGCPNDFSDYDADIEENPEYCSEFNYEVISKFLGKDSMLGLNLLDGSVKPTYQLLNAVGEGLILDPVLCYWRTMGDNTCNSCKYGTFQGQLRSCYEYKEQSTCELNSCGQSLPNGCKWIGSSCADA